MWDEKILSNYLSAVATPCKFGRDCLSSFLAPTVGFAQTPQLDGFESLLKSEMVSSGDFRRRKNIAWRGGALETEPLDAGYLQRRLRVLGSWESKMAIVSLDSPSISGRAEILSTQAVY